jgi:hypothetical protein
MSPALVAGILYSACKSYPKASKKASEKTA